MHLSCCSLSTPPAAAPPTPPERRQELQRQLEEIRAQAHAEALSAAQTQVEKQVMNTLQAEKAAYVENLTEAIAKERIKTGDERLMVQLYRMEVKAHQLEEREKELRKRDALYREHVTKLEKKCTEFYKVTAESFQRAKKTLTTVLRVLISSRCAVTCRVRF
ncbi:MICOS complex subunit Mic19 [Dissostichus eleginoides]|uniref:MICOS complex subunit Mic19 n=1 Tax=Dissostichus eleginoides TaxID=100907 RepID=A0AAD9BQF8_DISEL|nr:MICOS complex subunit Mic19 [Dissostichus eleginoides]